MSTSRQAMCAGVGHAWLPWGPWQIVQIPLPTEIRPLDAKPTSEIPPKVRYRQCERCGAGQSEDGNGQIVEITHG